MKYNIDKEFIAKIYKENRTNAKEVLNVQIKGKAKNVFIITFVDKDDLQHETGYVSSSQTFYVEEFFFELKRWVLKKGFYLKSYTAEQNIGYAEAYEKKSHEKITKKKAFNEKQAVIDLCKFIMDN